MGDRVALGHDREVRLPAAEAARPADVTGLRCGTWGPHRRQREERSSAGQVPLLTGGAGAVLDPEPGAVG
ncbi:MAG: hypothetical protein ACRDZY_20615, partial [Acidimicrobiales bacterium]